jgi:hypothetical protein
MPFLRQELLVVDELQQSQLSYQQLLVRLLEVFLFLQFPLQFLHQELLFPLPLQRL